MSVWFHLILQTALTFAGNPCVEMTQKFVREVLDLSLLIFLPTSQRIRRTRSGSSESQESGREKETGGEAEGEAGEREKETGGRARDETEAGWGGTKERRERQRESDL